MGQALVRPLDRGEEDGQAAAEGGDADDPSDDAGRQQQQRDQDGGHQQAGGDRPGDAVPVEQVSPGTIPVADTLPAGDGGDVLPNTATGTGAGDAALGSLPLTGFAAVGALATGLLLLSCGTVARSLAA